MKFKYVKTAISILIIAILFYSFNDIDPALIVSKITFDFLWQTIALLFLSIILRVVRWQLLMNDDGIQKISFPYSLKLLFIGQALNLVMPSGAGDVAKSFFGYKGTGIKERMFSVSLYDKIVAIASIGFLGIYSAVHTGEILYLFLSLLSFSPLVVIIVFPFFKKYNFVIKPLKWVDAKFQRIKIEEILNHLRFSFKTITISLILSVLAWIPTYLLLYICFISFGLNIKVVDVMIFSPILTLARLFPFTLNGLGSDELLMVYMFGKSNVNDKSLILLASIYYRLVLIIIPAIPGLIYLLFENKTKELSN